MQYAKHGLSNLSFARPKTPTVPLVADALFRHDIGSSTYLLHGASIPVTEAAKILRLVADPLLQVGNFPQSVSDILKGVEFLRVLFSEPVLRDTKIKKSPSIVEEYAIFLDGAIESLGTEAIAKTFTVQQVTPKVAHISASSRSILCSSFMRVQEFYESPKFKDTLFSREEYKDWYRVQPKSKGFSYYIDWAGFNVPEYAVRSIVGREETSGEKALIQVLQPLLSQKKFYLIGTAGSTKSLKVKDTVEHEIRHGLFHTEERYRAEVLEILAPLDLTPIFNWLENSGGYHPDVFRDEAHAYIGTDIRDWSRRTGIAIPSAWHDVHGALQRLAEKYVSQLS